MPWRSMTNPEKMETEHIDLWLCSSHVYHFGFLAQALRFLVTSRLSSPSALRAKA